MALPDYAFWMSSANLAYLEIAASEGFERVVLDIEHNGFAPDARESIILAARKMGLGVFCKIEAPEAVWVQRAVDLGIDGVIIPHAGRLAEMEPVFQTAKFPPLGRRSFAGGRSAGYMAPDDAYFHQSNADCLCLPMIETAEALDDIEAILNCPCVDGVFVGPFDLALSRGRGNYTFTESDRIDISRVAAAAKAAGKPWWIPAWSAAEQKFARENGVSVTVVGAEHQVLRLGLREVVGGLPG